MGGSELSKEHPETLVGAIPHRRRSTRAPFPGWCCLSPWLYQSSSFLPSRVMPPIQIRKLFQWKQHFSRSLFNA